MILGEILGQPDVLGVLLIAVIVLVIVWLVRHL